jgi:hypothetical protein
MNSLYGGGDHEYMNTHDISDTDTDTDTDNAYESINEDTSELHPPSQEFVNGITQMKQKVYNTIIFGNGNENENTDDAQSLKLVEQYVNILGGIYSYLYSLAHNNLSHHSSDLMKTVPNDAHQAVSQVIDWYRHFLTNNRSSEQRIPYESYLKNSLKHHPFTQAPEDN